MSDRFEPGRYWRVIYAVERPGGWRKNVWCESSNEAEVREALATCPGGGRLQRNYVRTEREWRDEE